MSQSTPAGDLPVIAPARIAIVTARWNGHITGALTRSAIDELAAYPHARIEASTFEVPGAVELTFAASQLIETEQFDAVIVFGCVIRGGTPHFDYVCQSVTSGITGLNADCTLPVIFGVLTVDTEADALDRIAGGSMGDKGAEAARAAIAMIHFNRTVADL